MALCDPMDCSTPGFSVHVIVQAKVLEWGAIAFSAPNSRQPLLHPQSYTPSSLSSVSVLPLQQKHSLNHWTIRQVPSARVLSHFSLVQLHATLWTVALQAPLSVGFSRQDYWSGLPRLPLDLPNSSNLHLLTLLHWQVGSLPEVPRSTF